MAENAPFENLNQTPCAPWEPEPPLPAEPPAPHHGVAAVRHFLAWAVLGVAAVLLISLATQVVGGVIGAVVIAVRDGMGADVDVSDNNLLTFLIMSQLISIAMFAPWWMRTRRRGLGIARPAAYAQDRDGGRAANLALVLSGIVLMGIGLQMLISLMLGLILPLFPEILREYDELMEAGGTDELAVLPVLSVAILAPISEELTVRGVAFQFALRGVSPAWSPRLASGAYAKIPVTPLRFWTANAIQALGFAILHLNIVQGVYAFAIGMALGWMFGRTGKLWYGMALHLAINFSSFFVEAIGNVFGVLGDAGVVVLPIICLAAGLRLFTRTVPVSRGSAFAREDRSGAPAESSL